METSSCTSSRATSDVLKLTLVLGKLSLTSAFMLHVCLWFLGSSQGVLGVPLRTQVTLVSGDPLFLSRTWAIPLLFLLP